MGKWLCGAIKNIKTSHLSDKVCNYLLMPAKNILSSQILTVLNQARDSKGLN